MKDTYIFLESNLNLSEVDLAAQGADSGKLARVSVVVFT